MARIGFIGLGHMGLPMATNLLKQGHAVTGYDISPIACKAFEQVGGKTVHTVEAIALNQECIITMLQTGEQVLSLYTKDNSLFKKAAPDTLFIDCSTIDVESGKIFHQKAKEYQFHSLDAPVSGGVAGAVAAKLTFMVGGEKSTLEKAQAILKSMGSNIIYAGRATSGQAAKICNNMLLGISMIAVSEAFILAGKLGLSAKKLHEVVTHASGKCWVMDNYVPMPNVLDNVPANNDYQPGFTAAMMLKDLKLSQHTATTTGIHPALAKKATELYEQLNAAGKGNKDFSAIIQYLAKTMLN